MAVAIRKRGRVLLAQRADDATRWAGMWEFPHTDRPRGETVDAAAARLLKSIGIRARTWARVVDSETRRDASSHHAHCIGSDLAARRIPLAASRGGEDGRRPGELADYPAGSAQQKLFEAVATPNRHLF